MTDHVVFRVARTENNFSLDNHQEGWYVFSNHTPAHKTDIDQRYYDRIWAKGLPTEEVATKIASTLQEEFERKYVNLQNI